MNQVTTVEVRGNVRAAAAERRARGAERRARAAERRRERIERQAKREAHRVVRRVRSVFFYVCEEVGFLPITKRQAPHPDRPIGVAPRCPHDPRRRQRRA